MKAYLNHFKLTDEPTCSCGKGDHKTDHIIYDCRRLTEERDKLRAAVKKTKEWPTSKLNLIKRHYNEFSNLSIQYPLRN